MSPVSRLDRHSKFRGCEVGSEVQHFSGFKQRVRHDGGHCDGESILLAPPICRPAIVDCTAIAGIAGSFGVKGERSLRFPSSVVPQDVPPGGVEGLTGERQFVRPEQLTQLTADCLLGCILRHPVWMHGLLDEGVNLGDDL